MVNGRGWLALSHRSVRHNIYIYIEIYIERYMIYVMNICLYCVYV